MIRDMMRVLKRRWPMTEALLVPAVVQGAEGAASICVGLHTLYERDDIDLIIVGRGGGSLEDLWCFNEEVVVRTIAASPVPIISAVGHESDVTLADFAADVRAGTPSMAAELAVPDGEKVMQELRDKRAQMDARIESLLAHKKALLKSYLASGLMREPAQLLASYAMALDQKTMALDHAMEAGFGAKTEAFTKKVAELEALSPLAVLGRGYTYAEKDGKALRSAKEINEGDTLSLYLTDGQVQAEVTSVTRKG